MGVVQKLYDNLINFYSGLGVPGRDKAVGSVYSFVPRTQMELEAAYMSDWIAGKIVDIPAEDSTRAWRAWQANNDEIEAIENLEKTLLVQQKLHEALILSRLHGGAALILGVDDGSSETELILENVKKDSLKFVHVCARYELEYDQGSIIQDLLSPYYGLPEYWSRRVVVDPVKSKPGQYDLKIHPSRIIILRGKYAPRGMQLQTSLGNDGIWGDSVLQRTFEAILNATGTAQAVATLVTEAKFDIIKIPELTAQMADEGFQGRLTNRFMWANASKSIINSILLDGEEEWNRTQTNFTALPEVVRIFLLMASGAADIPATRFLSQSPVGLSATGESDIRNYYDQISSQQSSTLSPAINRLDELIIRSALGDRDASIYYDWNPLWQMTAPEKADVTLKKAQTFKIDSEAGLMDDEALRIGRQNQLIEDAVYPGFESALEKQEMLSENSMMTPEEQDAEAVANAAPGLPGDPSLLDPSKVAKPTPGKKPALKMVKAGDVSPFAPFTAMMERIRTFGDAAPRTLYVYREVLNQPELEKWAARVGFKTTIPDMHVTICYSKTPIDWMKTGDDWGMREDGQIIVPPGGARLVDNFGDGAVVLCFRSPQLVWRHNQFEEAGASYDYAEYQPHITITYQPPDGMDVSKLEAYQGKIVLGPEIFEEIIPGAQDRIVET